MRKEIKEKWLEALRSGKYKKSQGALKKTDNTYCCLGVLCDIHRKTTKKKKNNWKAISHNAEAFDYDGDEGCLFIPEKVVKWAGLNPDVFNGVGYLSKSSMISLASINDKTDTFEPVIKAIEENF